MSFLENLRLALDSLRGNKLRSLLTMLGIIIGIASVITIETLGGSMTGSVTSTMSQMGANNITVNMVHKQAYDSNAAGDTGGVRLRLFMDDVPPAKDQITPAMLEEFKAAFPAEIDHLELSRSVGMASIGKVGDSSTTIQAEVRGANHDALLATERDNALLAGRWLDEARDGSRALCVVADTFLEQAVGADPQQALGRRITVQINDRAQSLYIVGVYDDNVDAAEDDTQTTLYIPLPLAARLAGSGEGYRSFTVAAANGTDVTAFTNKAERFFASYYTRNDSWTVQATSMASILETFTSLMSTVSLGISAIAAISLLVGGIGVMNIMTVSVTERTREIGTRKALGAPAGAIRMQFITESMVLCLFGGAIGVALGVGLGTTLAGLIGFEARPSLQAILVAFGFSMAIGVFFGYYPANKAARMDPIEALRYE